MLGIVFPFLKYANRYSIILGSLSMKTAPFSSKTGCLPESIASKAVSGTDVKTDLLTLTICCPAISSWMISELSILGYFSLTCSMIFRFSGSLNSCNASSSKFNWFFNTSMTLLMH